MIRTALAFIFIAAAGCIAQDAPGKAKESPEQKAVRAYLKENLPTGKFEEVRWWVPRDFKNGKRSIRLKYRTANKLGGIELYDDAFYFTKGKIVEWHNNDGKLFHGFDDEKPQ